MEEKIHVICLRERETERMDSMVTEGDNAYMVAKTHWVPCLDRSFSKKKSLGVSGCEK